MAKFAIPKAVAEINVLKLDGGVITERYSTEDDFYSALVRANLKNKRKTYKEFGDIETKEDGTKSVWIVIKATDSEDSEE